MNAQTQSAPAANGTQPPPAAALVTTEPKDIEVTGPDVAVGFDTVQGFNALQRIARLFSSSALVPDVYKNNIANTSIALDMAYRMRANPLMVMQNLYIVHGNPGWSAKFLIATFNQCGRFTAVRYRWTGEAGKANRGCTAWATEKATGQVVEGPEVTWSMAVMEKWTDKAGSKWKTMPELMFMYRAAAFMIRTTAPELTMGLPTAEELSDGPDGEAADAPGGPKGVAALKTLVRVQPETEPPHDLKTGEIIEPAQQQAPSALQAEEPKPATEKVDEAAKPKAAEDKNAKTDKAID